MILFIMKILTITLAFLGSWLPLCAQEKAAQRWDVEIPEPIAEGTLPEATKTSFDPPDENDRAAPLKRTFIPHSLEVKPFTPPPPPVVKRLPVVRVAAATSAAPCRAARSYSRGNRKADLASPPQF